MSGTNRNYPDVIVHPAIYECPKCGFRAARFPPGPIWEAGSGGMRTFECPKCHAILSE